MNLCAASGEGSLTYRWARNARSGTTRRNTPPGFSSRKVLFSAVRKSARARCSSTWEQYTPSNDASATGNPRTMSPNSTFAGKRRRFFLTNRPINGSRSRRNVGEASKLRHPSGAGPAQPQPYSRYLRSVIAPCSNEHFRTTRRRSIAERRFAAPARALSRNTGRAAAGRRLRSIR